tara:strand:- start:33 stop:572 length:540 start_codon:yes stop_codon:yes gene_type:complete
MYDNEEFIVQLNKENINLDYSNNNCTIKLDENMSNVIEDINNFVIENTSKNSLKWFGKEISVENCSKIFKNSLAESSLNCYVDEECQFYKRKEILNGQDLENNIIGIPLIKCTAIIYTKGSFYIRWELIEFKIKLENKKTQKDIIIEEYSILDKEEDNKPLSFYDNENLINKLDKITLF